MIEVQMRVDDNINLLRLDAGGIHALEQHGLRLVDARLPRAQLIADAGFNQDVLFPGPNQQ